MTQHEHSTIQTRTVWRRQRARNKFELQFVAGVRAPFAGPYLLNFELIFLQEKWLTMNIQQFKLEQFDVPNALATSLSCNGSRACAHPLLDPTCWTLNSFFSKRNDSPCNARNRRSHPLPVFYDWGECVSVYVLKRCSVQAVPHPIFENVTVQCENTCFVSTTCFLWLRRVCQSICFKREFSQDGPAPYFWKRDRAMRDHVFRIHHHIFMSEESVSEYMF